MQLSYIARLIFWCQKCQSSQTQQYRNTNTNQQASFAVEDSYESALEEECERRRWKGWIQTSGGHRPYFSVFSPASWRVWLLCALSLPALDSPDTCGSFPRQLRRTCSAQRSRPGGGRRWSRWGATRWSSLWAAKEAHNAGQPPIMAVRITLSVRKWKRKWKWNWPADQHPQHPGQCTWCSPSHPLMLRQTVTSMPGKESAKNIDRFNTWVLQECWRKWHRPVPDCQSCTCGWPICKAILC